MPNGKKKKGHKMATHKRKKRLRKHIAYTNDRAGAQKAQVPITEFLNFFERQ